MRTFYKKKDYFIHNNVKYSISQLVTEFVRSSNIEIIDESTGFDITKDVLMQYTFKSADLAYEYLYNFLTPFDMAELASCGGAEAAIWRRLRGIE